MKIIKDTREQKGYSFEFYDDIEVVRKKLDYGDYTVYGTGVVVERKASTGEIYLNLATNKERERVYRELEELSKFPTPVLLFEFPEINIDIFPEGSNIPQDKWSKLRINSYRLRMLFDQLKKDFPKIEFIFTENKYDAEDKLVEIFKDYEHGPPKKKFSF